MDAAWEVGITTFDTADAYGGGRSETCIGEWLRAKGAEVRDRIVLTTKTFNPMSEGADRGLAPRRGSAADRGEPRAARRRIGRRSTSRTTWTRTTPVGGDARRVRRARRGREDPGLRRQQRRRGLARGGARAHGRPEWVQNALLAARARGRRDRAPGVPRDGLGYTPFSPLAGGWLTGKYRRGEAPPAGSRMTLRPEPYLHLQADASSTRSRRSRRRRGERGDDDGRARARLAAGPPAGHGGRRRAAPAEQLRPALEALELELSPPEREQLTALFA